MIFHFWHRWTPWYASLVEDDERYTLVTITDIQWRICKECGAQEERDLCASS